ncbi:MAG: sulfatase-like hydrolase/transferase, partial [Planctomycetota bacterium]
MKRREFNKLAVTAGACAALDRAGLAAEPAPENQRPNILFIMTDQQHAGMMSCTGNTWLKTPALDSLAREGIRFERAYSANPYCVPSRSAMAT